MILANQTEEATQALRAIHYSLDRIMGGDGAVHLRIETLNDIFLRTLELQAESALKSKAIGLVDHLRLVSEKLEEVMGLPASKKLP